MNEVVCGWISHPTVYIFKYSIFKKVCMIFVSRKSNDGFENTLISGLRSRKGKVMGKEGCGLWSGFGS